MSTAAAPRLHPRSGWTPWPERLFGSVSPSPVWTGLGLSLLAFIPGLALTSLSGDLRAFTEPGLLQDRDARIVAFLCVLVGFLPACQQYLLRSAEANLNALAPSFVAGVDPIDTLELRRPNFWLWIVPGTLLMPAIAYAVDRDFSFYLQPEYFLQPMHWFQ